MPDGRALTVRSERSILFDDWALAVDGVAVPGSLHDVDTAVARVSSWVRWAVGSRLFYVLLDWRDGVSRPLWIELLAPALAAAGGLLLWRRRQSALPVLIASAVAWVLTGASTWFSFVWAAWFIAIAVRARAVLRDAAPVELRQLGGATTAMAVPTMTSTPSAAVGRSSDAG